MNEPPSVRKAGALSVRRSVLWGVVGTAVYAICQWGLLILTARFGSPTLVGQFSLGLAVTAPILMLSNMQLANLLATDASRSHPFAEYHRLRLQTVVLSGIAIIVCVFLRDSVEDRVVIGLVGLSKLVEAISDIHYGLFHRERRLDGVARSQILRGMLGTFGFWLSYSLGLGLPVAVAMLALGWSLVLVGHDRGLVRQHPEWNDGTGTKDGVRRLVRQAFPLGVVAALVSLNVSLPRLMVERFVGHHSLGVFAAMASLIVAGRLVVIPIAQTLAPRLGAAATAGDRAQFVATIRLSLIGALVMGCAGVAVALVAGEPVLTLLYGPEFADETQAFLILMGAAAFGYLATFLQVAATAARVLRRQVLVTASAVLTTVLLTWTLVPRFGLVGASWAVLGSAIVEFLASVVLIGNVVSNLRASSRPAIDD